MERREEVRSQRTRWLFENHVEFLSTHRGVVTRLGDAFTVESDRPEFTYAVLGRGGDHSLLERFQTAHLIPWSEPWEQTLSDPRYQRRGGLTYMTFDGDTSGWGKNPEVQTVRVSSAEEMDVFSHVQAAGFAQTQEDYGRWHLWLRQANHRNLKNSTQIFYVGYVGGKPASTALLVMTKNLGGIYAVTTLAEFRKQGIASALMASAIADARMRGAGLVTLQVSESSYAESLYKKQGFAAQFQSRIFGR